MKNKWMVGRVIGLIFGIAAITLIVISMFNKIDKYFLMAGLLCNCIALTIVLIINKKEKNK